MADFLPYFVGAQYTVAPVRPTFPAYYRQDKSEFLGAGAQEKSVYPVAPSGPVLRFEGKQLVHPYLQDGGDFQRQ